MVDIDIHTNSKHFSLFASCRIIEWSKQAMELCEQDREEKKLIENVPTILLIL